MTKWTETKCIGVALDPVHIGTGGMRLGRVDATVVREPVTNVPKIPGTSLSGALKFFTDLSLRSEGIKNNICASINGSDTKKNKHNVSKCPICVAFGHTVESENISSTQGILQFTDALLLAYPVNSLLGPIWITTKKRLKDLLNIGDGIEKTKEKFSLLTGFNIPNPLDNKLNFGWVMLEQAADSEISVEQIEKVGVEKCYAERMVIVEEWVFAHLVNDNMEVRTSVVIDPETGAASNKGLFTFEASVRGAIFVFNMIENQFHELWNNIDWKDGDKSDCATDMIKKHGFPGIAAVGLGGMTTRGFGRIKFKTQEV